MTAQACPRTSPVPDTKVIPSQLTLTSVRLTLVLTQRNSIIRSITINFTSFIPERLTMGQCIPGNGFESLVDVDTVFGGDFEVWDRRLIGLAPRQCSLLRHLQLISFIRFKDKENGNIKRKANGRVAHGEGKRGLPSVYSLRRRFYCRRK